MKKHWIVFVVALIAFAAFSSPLSCAEREGRSSQFAPLNRTAAFIAASLPTPFGLLIDYIIQTTEIGWHEGTNLTDPRADSDSVAASQLMAKKSSDKLDLSKVIGRLPRSTTNSGMWR
ncbi:MAG: hypothetical protein PHR28_08055 [candidate division Zixibacteria bacterium]|nr:hypothetical protein [candidate division Zixibacteria bacterium]